MRGVAWLALGAMVAGCDGSDGGTDGDDCSGGASRTEDILCLEGDAGNGATVYSDNCADCHGPEGEGMDYLGSDIREKTAEEIVDVVLQDPPPTGMLDLSEVLSDQEIADVAAYIESDL